MYYIYVDEAGRWPLAGPVRVGLIIEKIAIKHIIWSQESSFPAKNESLYSLCADSKVLSESKRDELYSMLSKNKKICWSTASVSAAHIDKHGVVWWLRNAIMRAMHAHFVGWRFSLSSLQERLISIKHKVTIVVDWPSDFGLRKALWVSVVTVVDGDALVLMISAASILAKVERDAYMIRIEKKHPWYGFAQHKWYGTKGHYIALENLWLCREHRKSYIHEKE
jgi:ribonuclease HII